MISWVPRRASCDSAPTVSFQGAMAANLATGGDLTYEGPYWMARNPMTMLKRIVDNDIPAFLTGGWYDLFQRGEPLNYSGLQNAYAGRPVTAPMRPNQRLTGRYQLLMGPWYRASLVQPRQRPHSSRDLRQPHRDHEPRAVPGDRRPH